MTYWGCSPPAVNLSDVTACVNYQNHATLYSMTILHLSSNTMMIYKRGFTDLSQGLAVGLIATGSTLLFICVLFLVYVLRVRRRRRASRDAEIGQDVQLQQHITSAGSIHTRMVAPLPPPPRPMFGPSAKEYGASQDPYRSDSEPSSIDKSPVQMTQFEIEIGRKERTGSVILKRLRSKESNETSQKTCRRRLSKKNLNADIKPPQRPATLMRDHSGGADVAHSVSTDLTSTSSTRSGSTTQQTTAVSPARYTRGRMSRQRSASAGVATRTATSHSPKTTGTRPEQHGRSLSFGGGLAAPAPVGPLPPLPKSIYNNSSTTAIRKNATSPQSSPSRSVSGHRTREAARARAPSDTGSAPSEHSRWRVPGHTVTTPSPARSVHSQSASIKTWRPTSTSSQKNNGETLWISPLRIAGTGRVHRASSVTTPTNSYTVQAAQNNRTFSSTPRKAQNGVRTALNGSAASRKQGANLQGVLKNASPSSRHQSPPRSKEKAETSQSSLLVGIKEESPRGSVSSKAVPIFALRPHVLPSPDSSKSPIVKWTASLSPSTSAPSMSAKTIAQRQADIEFSRESSGILSVPSISSLGQVVDLQERSVTPTFELTRPSGEVRRDGESSPLIFESPIQPSRFDDTDFSWSPARDEDEGYDKSWTPLAHHGSREPLLPREPSGLSADVDAIRSSITNPFINVAVVSTEPIDAPKDDSKKGKGAVSQNVDIVAAYITPINTGICTPVTASPLAPQTETCSPLGSHPPAKSLSTSRSPSLVDLMKEDQSTVLVSPTPDREESPSQDKADRSIVKTMSPSRARQRLSASLKGPRHGPEKDLRRSIMKLRRENSEARWSGGREQRRYLKLGREASPALPFAFSVPVDSDDIEEPSLLEDVQPVPLSDPTTAEDSSDIIAIYADARESMLQPEPLSPRQDQIQRLLDNDMNASIFDSDTVFPSPTLPKLDPVSPVEVTSHALPTLTSMPLQDSPSASNGISISKPSSDQSHQSYDPWDLSDSTWADVENHSATPTKDSSPGLRMMMVRTDRRHVGALSPVEEMASRTSSQYGVDSPVVSPVAPRAEVGKPWATPKSLYDPDGFLRS
ncbi:hypothetical protein K461DRAFT_140659 [Myriangium duriaei CBS 260.36]|uniref:Uncharacterized protein n=1 Tax=Myriangium duriaei CBS 260.36 TaxID=1168546 RepID=A0A9P4MKS3_9PEZI|nr:hypothetical protein K461DRAFT_140659 [Myriangium duriaei CBS 260.36]